MIFASNNKGKLREIKIIFKEEIKSLQEINIDIEIEEDQKTFYENALKKAKEIYKIVKEPVIADDSGLCITVLNNWPGVYTHRFLGDNKTDSERNEEILCKMRKQSNREAKVICSLVYFDGKKILQGRGELRGRIALQARGKNGFGFDEIFELESGKTLAELSENEKNQISARYLAAIDLKQKLSKKD